MWWDNLRQASFRGVPFGVFGAEGRYGRRNADHEYPYRDIGYVEDMGRKLRRYQVVGFLLEGDVIYGGGDAMAQRDKLVAAAEAAGKGSLVHPTLGLLTVNVDELAVVEKWDQGRYFEITFTFVEAGQRVFPSISASTGSSLNDAADSFDVASVLSFVGQINSILRWPVEAVKQAIATAAAWGAIAGNLANDATNLFNVVGTLQGAYGRYFGGANKGLTGVSTAPAAAAVTIPGLISQGASKRAAVATATSALSAAATSLTPSTSQAVASAAQGVVAALLASTVDPADGVRLLSALTAFYPSTASLPSSIGQAISTTETALGDLFRRAAIAGLARASALYQPASSDEAVQVRNAVTALIDAEIDVAGDEGDDGAFVALQAVRQAVVADMNSKGGALPALKSVTVRSSLPAPVLAQLLYQDGSRADQLVTGVDPAHPAFMPVSFKALAN